MDEYMESAHGEGRREHQEARKEWIKRFQKTKIKDSSLLSCVSLALPYEAMRINGAIWGTFARAYTAMNVNNLSHL